MDLEKLMLEKSKLNITNSHHIIPQSIVSIENETDKMIIDGLKYLLDYNIDLGFNDIIIFEYIDDYIKYLNNVVIGINAGNCLTTGSDNIAIGIGTNNINNVFIGNNAGNCLTTGSNSIVIGNNDNINDITSVESYNAFEYIYKIFGVKSVNDGLITSEILKKPYIETHKIYSSFLKFEIQPKK
jgi:hypothetical protein